MAAYRRNRRRDDQDFFDMTIELFKWGHRHGGIKLSLTAIGVVMIAACGLLVGFGMKINFVPFAIGGAFILGAAIIYFLQQRNL
jgi:hypothetical protein